MRARGVCVRAQMAETEAEALAGIYQETINLAHATVQLLTGTGAAAARGAPRTAPWRVPPAEACQSNEKNAESYDDNGGVFVAAGASLRERGRVRFCWRSHCADLIQRHALLADRAIEDQLRAPPFDLPMRVLQPRRYPDVRTSWYLSSGGVFFYNQAEPDLRKMFDFRK